MANLEETLFKIASELEQAASVEADVKRLHKMAHMLTAINGLSLIKSAGLGEIIGGAISKIVGKSSTEIPEMGELIVGTLKSRGAKAISSSERLQQAIGKSQELSRQTDKILGRKSNYSPSPFYKKKKIWEEIDKLRETGKMIRGEIPPPVEQLQRQVRNLKGNLGSIYTETGRIGKGVGKQIGGLKSNVRALTEDIETLKARQELAARTIDNLHKQLEKGLITPEEFNAAMRQLQGQMQGQMRLGSKELSGSIGQAIGRIKGELGNKIQALELQDRVILEATSDLYKRLEKGLITPEEFNAAMRQLQGQMQMGSKELSGSLGGALGKIRSELKGNVRALAEDIETLKARQELAARTIGNLHKQLEKGLITPEEFNAAMRQLQSDIRGITESASQQSSAMEAALRKQEAQHAKDIASAKRLAYGLGGLGALGLGTGAYLGTRNN